MHRLRAVPAVLVLIPLLTAPALAAVGMLRPPAAIRTEQFGQFAEGAGLECIGTNAQAAVGLYDLDTGARLAVLLPPLDAGTQTFHVLDSDGDGIDEVLGLRDLGGTAVTEVSLQVYDPRQGAMTAVFPTVLLPARSVRFVGTMRLNSANPAALVFQTDFSVYIVRLTGAIRYDSGTDPSWPPTGGGTLSVFIDSFEGNGFDQLAVTFEPAGPGTFWNMLIGDTAPAVTADDAPLAASPRLMPSRPNPARGAARIGFELPQAAEIQLQVYDAQGRLVTRLASGPMVAGRHERLWDGRGLSGARVPAGTYFYELVVDGARETRKLIQLR